MSSRALLPLLFLGLDELELEETSTEVGGVSGSVMPSCCFLQIQNLGSHLRGMESSFFCLSSV